MHLERCLFCIDPSADDLAIGGLKLLARKPTISTTAAYVPATKIMIPMMKTMALTILRNRFSLEYHLPFLMSMNHIMAGK